MRLKKAKARLFRPLCTLLKTVEMTERFTQAGYSIRFAFLKYSFVFLSEIRNNKGIVVNEALARRLLQ